MSISKSMDCVSATNLQLMGGQDREAWFRNSMIGDFTANTQVMGDLPAIISSKRWLQLKKPPNTCKLYGESEKSDLQG
ncbi:MAG: hypothetical protein Q4E09_04995 [Eubacteriales bacterium]|nr:hypothetical protein [Eubacteriales bacterium]